MYRSICLAAALAAGSLASWAQRPVELSDLYESRVFNARGIQGFRSLEDGAHFSRQTAQGIERFSFATGTAVDVMVSKEDLKVNGAPLNFSSYEFAPGERYVIFETDIEPIYRHSYTANVYVWDRQGKKLTPVFGKPIQNPVLSPDGTQLAFVFERNIYVQNLATAAVKQVTTDGADNAILNGAPDWVYEEEFGFHVALAWSPDSKSLAYLRFDERAVPTFSMDVYGTETYPKPYVFKYPKAGEVNSVVSLHVWNGSATVTASEGLRYEYIPRMAWSPKGELFFATLNRHQDSMQVMTFTAGKAPRRFLLETDAAYVESEREFSFLADGRLVWASERSGFTHYYLYSADGSKVSPLTRGAFDVTAWYGVDEKRAEAYYQAASRSASQREVFRIKLNGGNPTALAAKAAWNDAEFSTSFDYYVLTAQDGNSPATYALMDRAGKQVRMLEDNAKLRDDMKSFALSPKTFFTLEAANGQKLPAWEIRPVNFDASKKYPVLMFVYGGPGSQQVTQRWGGRDYFWYQMLAAKGYWIVCVDNRGTGALGRDFKKVTYLQLGKYEVEDQIAAAQSLAKHPNVDASRIGIWGWSYGGFMSSNCLLQGADVFKAAIAVAPVTNWRFYDNIYTERYMRTPAENSTNYDVNSPLAHAAKLKGKLLLVHGSADDNVHVQNAMRLAEELIQANKQFDYMVYPDKNHGIFGGATRYQLYTKMTNFILENL
ncbi:MAG: S9 family peptidase [Bacteroidetes bacterium]|nr:S9 family peptidase [Bacteroidota bacterium]